MPPISRTVVRFVHGDVGDPDAVAKALDGVDRVVHLAAAVGVGQSMYEIARYVRTNTLRNGRVPGAAGRERRASPQSSSSPRPCRSTAKARTRCAEHGDVAPRPRARSSSSLARHWELRCPVVRRASSRRFPTLETKPLIPTSVYAVTKRDHEELCLVVGAAYGNPDGCTALLQRLRPWPGALEPVHRRRGDLLLAAAERQRACRVRGRPPVARLHPRQRHRARASCCALGVRRTPSARPVNLGTGQRRSTVRRGRRRARVGSRRRARARAHRPIPCRRHPSLLRATRLDGARAARLRGAESGSRTACADLVRLAPQTRRPDDRCRRQRRELSGPVATALRWRPMHDLAIIIVSTNEGSLAPAVP